MMSNVIDLLGQMDASKIAYYLPEYSNVLASLEARAVNEAEVSKQLASALILMPCSCRREYAYHGKGVSMCVRCRALVLWETLEHGRSEIQAHFDKVIPK